jgi:hypothetical protein
VSKSPGMGRPDTRKVLGHVPIGEFAEVEQNVTQFAVSSASEWADARKGDDG